MAKVAVSAVKQKVVWLINAHSPMISSPPDKSFAFEIEHIRWKLPFWISNSKKFFVSLLTLSRWVPYDVCFLSVVHTNHLFPAGNSLFATSLWKLFPARFHICEWMVRTLTKHKSFSLRWSNFVLIVSYWYNKWFSRSVTFEIRRITSADCDPDESMWGVDEPRAKCRSDQRFHLFAAHRQWSLIE